MVVGTVGSAEACLVGELDAMTRLHRMASRFVRDGDLAALLSDAVGTALAIVGADAGFIATAADGAPMATVAARLGCERPSLDDPTSTRLGQALHEAHRAHEGRIVVEDADATPARAAPIAAMLRAMEVRGFQSTPVRAPSGALVGLVATQHRRPWRPRDKDLQLLDLVARQCGDAIDRDAAIRACNVQNAELQANKLRETEELFRNTVENMPDNLILYDRAWRIVYINASLARICERVGGRPAGELLGLKGSEVWPENVWQPLLTNGERAIATRERQTYETVLAFPRMSPAVRQWTVVPLAGPDGEVRQILAMSHDVTAQRRLVDELREADERKSAFIAMLSHELRNPLAAIRTNLYVLEHSPPGSEAGGHATRVIDRQIGHLVGMVDDLLDVTRITQNKIHLRRQRLDLNVLVRETVEDNRSHLERGGVRFELRLCDRPLPVEADGARIAQVVTNLLTNAAKFTAAGGTVRVSLYADGGGRGVLSVADSGAGIDPALLGSLFQPFMQGDRSLDRTGGGLGLGLALVKGLVELHGGDVTAHSDGPNRGAEFVVRLPLAGAGVSAGSPSDGTATESARRVLVIEDDLEIAEGLRVALRIADHVVEIARNGPSALEKARAFKPDAVLCDIGLPGMDGYAVARAFRADAALGATFLIALSGYAQAEDVAKARAAGFDHHLAKPASVEKIHRALATGTRTSWRR
ncbi:MAG TPA: ATP-binding protein [Polyangia bacterium]|nr:ATP-binding protein [Polyangia bacterium]